MSRLALLPSPQWHFWAGPNRLAWLQTATGPAAGELLVRDLPNPTTKNLYWYLFKKKNTVFQPFLSTRGTPTMSSNPAPGFFRRSIWRSRLKCGGKGAEKPAHGKNNLEFPLDDPDATLWAYPGDEAKLTDKCAKEEEESQH